jgi:hypothetical protein
LDGARMQYRYLGYVTPRYRPGRQDGLGSDDSARD